MAHECDGQGDQAWPQPTRWSHLRRLSTISEQARVFASKVSIQFARECEQRRQRQTPIHWFACGAGFAALFVVAFCFVGKIPLGKLRWENLHLGKQDEVKDEERTLGI